MPQASKLCSPVKLFYCYSQKDSGLRSRLDTHLAGLKRDGLVQTWYDREIVPGANWEEEISLHLDDADIVLLLISPDFIDSDYCMGIEMKRALQDLEAGRLTVIPILLKPYVWPGAKFKMLQALPKNGKPVTAWKHREYAFQSIVEGIEATARAMVKQRTAVLQTPSPLAAKEQARNLRRLLFSRRARAFAAFTFVGLLAAALLLQYVVQLIRSDYYPAGTPWFYAAADPAYFCQRRSLLTINRSTDAIGIITLSKNTEPREILTTSVFNAHSSPLYCKRLHECIPKLFLWISGISVRAALKGKTTAPPICTRRSNHSLRTARV